MGELEAKLNQIADNLLVQTRLVERFERRTEERLGDHEDRMDRIETAMENLANGSGKLQAVSSAHEERLAQHRERMDHIEHMLKEFAEGNRTLQAALNGLVETVDRFIRGQRGDGRG